MITVTKVAFYHVFDDKSVSLFLSLHFASGLQSAFCTQSVVIYNYTYLMKHTVYNQTSAVIGYQSE